MIAGADFIRYLLSAGGLIFSVLIVAVWIAAVPTSRRARHVLLFLALGFTAVSVYGIQYWIARGIAAGYRPFTAADVTSGPRTAIVVLGSGSVDAEDWSGATFAVVDRGAASRVLEAWHVFKLVDPAIVISSGGYPYPNRRKAPTAETMRDALVSLGVPRDRIVVETVSKTTRDEAVVVAPILEAQRVSQVILVTSQTHMRRSLGAFRAVGILAIPAIAQDFELGLPKSEWLLPTERGLWQASSNAHEVIGTIYYWLRGWWRR